MTCTNRLIAGCFANPQGLDRAIRSNTLAFLLCREASSVTRLLTYVAVLATALAAYGWAFTGPRRAPETLTLGTLYAASGPFATSSMAEYSGLRFWVAQVNAQGGTYVGPNHRREKVDLIAYNDRSSPALASRLYARLVLRRHVDLLVSDFGSVLTGPGVAVAKANREMLIDPTGTGARFFTGDNPYIVLTSLPSSAVWPDPLSAFLISRRLGRVGIIYSQNDFDRSQEQTVAAQLTLAGMAPVFTTSLPTDNYSYQDAITALFKAHAQAILEFGYQDNDIAFLNQLQAAKARFAMVFTAFPGQLPQLLRRRVGVRGLLGTFTYGFPPEISRSQTNLGLSTPQFIRRFLAGHAASVNFLQIAGYNAGLIVQAALQHATDLGALGLRAALNGVSGKLNTLDGTFRTNASGAQVGELLPVAELFASGRGLRIAPVYPPSAADANPIFHASS